MVRDQGRFNRILFLLGYNLFSYLSVVSGVISEADYIFIPESPPPYDWPQRLCNKLIQASKCYFLTNFFDVRLLGRRGY